MSALYTQCPGDAVQTGTGKVDPARKFKCTTAARDYQYILLSLRHNSLTLFPLPRTWTLFTSITKKILNFAGIKAFISQTSYFVTNVKSVIKRHMQNITFFKSSSLSLIQYAKIFAKIPKCTNSE